MIRARLVKKKLGRHVRELKRELDNPKRETHLYVLSEARNWINARKRRKNLARKQRFDNFHQS